MQRAADTSPARPSSTASTTRGEGASNPQPPVEPGRLQVRGLRVDLREFHLREIELDVAPGEYFVVLGPTGAGKTVLLETIAGLFEPQQGRVLMDGTDITTIPPDRRRIGFVYQDYALFPHLSVAENIAFGLRLGGVRSAVPVPDALQRLAGRLGYTTEQQEGIRQHVEDMSRLLSINHLLHRHPETLSGGEQQRVALARALVVEPRLLLMDEPLSALDPETRESLQRELARVHRALGTTTLHVTHDFEEAVALGDRIGVVHQGRILQVGVPEEIFRRPADQFVARFVGARNIFEGVVSSDRQERGCRSFRSSDLELAVITELSGPAHASIRPEDIVISGKEIGSSARNHFRGRVLEIADRGTLIYVTVSVPQPFTAVITRRSLEEMALQVDEQVYIAFKASAVHVF